MAFIGNVCFFIHPIGEEDSEILVSLLAETFTKTKRGFKKGKVRIRMSEWVVQPHIPSQISRKLLLF